MNAYERRGNWISKLRDGVFMYFSKSLERVKFEEWLMCFFVFLEMVSIFPYPLACLNIWASAATGLHTFFRGFMVILYIYIYIYHLVTVLSQFPELHIGFFFCICHFHYFIFNCNNFIQQREERPLDSLSNRTFVLYILRIRPFLSVLPLCSFYNATWRWASNIR